MCVNRFYTSWKAVALGSVKGFLPLASLLFKCTKWAVHSHRTAGPQGPSSSCSDSYFCSTVAWCYVYISVKWQVLCLCWS